jgi:selenide,water dikinase
MRGVTASQHPDLLVGVGTWDDAGVFRLTDDLALVQTVDFFTPIVDEPAAFGAVAAANALSDVYAMGGEPLTALGIVGFPHDALPLELLSETLEGAQTVLREAGVPLVGGHTVKDAEFKVGFAVTGRVHPDRIVSNAGARPGDRLLLTKPLGTGILATAIKRDRLDATATRHLIEVMRTLNRDACRAMCAAGVHAATDITGYGLAGHATSMARASGVSMRVHVGALPLLPGALELLAEGVFPGGLKGNASALADQVRGPFEAQPAWRIVFDPQTSGGLLVALPPEAVDAFQTAYTAAGHQAAPVVGEVLPAGTTRLELVA